MKPMELLRKISPKKKFPLKVLIVIVIGIAGMFFTHAITPYIEEGTEIINQIPDVELCSLSGEEVVYSIGDYRPKYAYVVVEDINKSALIYVYWDVEAGWLRDRPGEFFLGVEGYIFDEDNFNLWMDGKDAEHISYGQLAILGQMYGIAPEDGNYYVVFDNSELDPKNLAFKTIIYNIRSYIPTHEERISEEGPKWVAKSLNILFIGIILVALLNLFWLKFRYKEGDEKNEREKG